MISKTVVGVKVNQIWVSLSWGTHNKQFKRDLNTIMGLIISAIVLRNDPDIIFH